MTQIGFEKLLWFCVLLALLLVCKADAAAKEIVFAVEGGKNMLGIYYYGDNIDDHDHFAENLPEHFIRTVNPKERMVEAILPSSSFVLRSSDMRSRAKIAVERNLDQSSAKSHPFKLTFTNLAYNDRSGDLPLELQHGSSGYVWLDGGHYVTHATGSGHRFILRDVNKQEFFTVVVFEMDEREL